MNVDLSARVGAVRDQGKRPTCLSFALSDGHRIARVHGRDFSPECLHQLTTSQLKIPITRGIPPGEALSVLATSGQTEETSWPYNGSIVGTPPFFKKVGALGSFSSTTLLQDLMRGCGSILGLEIGDEFYSATATTVLTQRISAVQARHAVLAIGSRASGNEAEFRIRNSWGSAWADSGHVWVHESYLATVCIDVMCLEP